MINYLIDTDCAVYSMTAQFPALGKRLSDCMPGQVAISAVNFAEVTLGAELGKPPPLELLQAFVRVVPILPFDEAAARAYAQLPFKRARFDRLLAAHALSIGATVITNNEADFTDVPGLKIENWTV